MAETLDLLTLDEGKRALNIPLADTSFDTEVASYITAVSQRIDDLCGPVVKRTVTGEVQDGGSDVVFPTYSPVLSVTTVTEYLSGTGTALTAETLTTAGDYLVEDLGTHNSRIMRRSRFGGRPFGAGKIAITYVAGRVNDTASVSPKFKQGAAKMLSHMWKGDQGAGSATFGAPETPLLGLGFAIPNAVVELLAQEIAPPVMA